MSIAEIVSHDLKLTAPWQVEYCNLDQAKEFLTITIVADPTVELCCPICGRDAPSTSGILCTWRHLNFMEFSTVIQAVVPQVECATHGVSEVSVTWAQAGALGTYNFEAELVGLMTPDNIPGIAKLYRLSLVDALDIWNRRAAK